MAQIVVNEISQNYTYNIGRNTFATVALPITASWGPAYTEPADGEIEEMLELTQWQKFPATQQGLEAFVSTYRGPASNYRLAKDFSYQMAMTLLTSGYDVLACRVCPGNKAEAKFKFTSCGNTLIFGIKAKYPGTFGNNLKVVLTPVQNRIYWNLVVYVVDNSGIQTAVENLIFVFDVENSSDTIPHIDEVESNFLDFVSHINTDTIRDDFIGDDADAVLENGISKWVRLTGGTDTPDLNSKYFTDTDSKKAYALVSEKPSDWTSSYTSYFTKTTVNDNVTATAVTGATAPTWSDNTYYTEVASIGTAIKNLAYKLAVSRYTGTKLNDIVIGAGYTDARACEYLETLNQIVTTDEAFLSTQYYKEWCYNAAFLVYQLLKDKLNYNPQRIISPGWDDQDICSLNDSDPILINQVSPLHKIIMEVAYYSRCATGMIDIPKSCSRKDVYNDSATTPGYAQLLSRVDVATGGSDVNAILYNTHAALFAPWGQYKYVGTGKQNPASLSFIALLIQRAQILNQPLQYEWALPTNRKHNLKLGKFDYKVPKKLLDVWQKLEGVGVNVLTEIPELGVNLWGNSTLFEVPPATYQALANLSTRYLVNAVEDIAYKCGISITFQYNNEQAYNKFYAGVTPTLDTMKNVGAIDDYYVKMAADINGLDQVNANTVIGKIYLVINGVINDIVIDLIALPPGVDLNQYKS